jgi:hypothetical protein
VITTLDRLRVPAHAVVPAVALSFVLVLAGTGLAPLAPLAAAAGLLLLWAAPMQRSALALLFVALVADNPGERPFEGKWVSPLGPLGDLLYLNLNRLTGIEALRMSLLEVAAGLLMLVVLLRKTQRDPIDDPQRLGALPNPVKYAFAWFFGAIVLLELYGLATGGDFKNSLWQLRQLFWLPVLGIVFGNALKTANARLWLLRAVIAVAVLRGLIGIHYWLTIARPSGTVFEYTTTHSDSVLTVTAILITAMLAVVRPSAGHVLLNVLVQPVLGLALIANDRRIAFVSLAGGGLALLLLSPPDLKRVLRRLALAASPLVLLYMAVGWHASHPLFGPVQTVRSVIEQDDDSSKTRDIENYNLILTLKANPVLGSGFGHEYREAVQALRVDHVFAQYKYIAHNSVLWLLAIGGWLGFAAVWLIFPVAVLVALRVFAECHDPIDRTVAYGAIVAVLALIVQAWGDMGLQSWMAALLVAAFVGATGALWTTRERATALPTPP